MVDKTRINPPWLKKFVKTKFELRCYYHSKHHCMRYCKDCMEEPAFCDKCNVNSCKESKYHQGHTILRVYKASNKIGVRTIDINKLWKISKIEPFTINESRIVYLCSRKVVVVHKTKPSAHACRICGYEISSGSNKYCSIACKMERKSRKGQVCFLDQQQLEGAYKDYNAVLDQQLPEGTGYDNIDLPHQEQPEGADKENKWPVGSFRKRSRKGIPMRSPLF